MPVSDPPTMRIAWALVQHVAPSSCALRSMIEVALVVGDAGMLDAVARIIDGDESAYDDYVRAAERANWGAM